MKKTLILGVILLLCLTACGAVQEDLYLGDYPVPESVSDELKAEVETAWRSTHNESIKWTFPLENSDRDYYIRYYGTFDGYVVIYWCYTNDIKQKTYLIGDQEFSHWSGIIYAYKGGKFISLQEVYEGGSLSQESLAEIARRHGDFEQIMADRQTAAAEKLKAEWPDLKPIPEKTLTKMEEAWLAWKQNTQKQPLYWAEPGIEFWRSQRMRYYGTYGECVVFGRALSSNLDTSKTQTHRVAGGLFACSRELQLYAYCDGQIYDLEDAYAAGLLSAADVAKAADYHQMYELYAEEMKEQWWAQ